MDHTRKIQALNDEFRATFNGGRVVVTAGVRNLHFLAELIGEIQRFNTFDDGNDPHQEHDFGSVQFRGDTFFWKIDYYGNDMESGSPDPSDASITTRILTVMLANEY